jgi:DNA-binding NtrC family response regulator
MVQRRVLVVSRHNEIQQLGRRFAQEVLVADDIAEAMDIAATVEPDVILLDGVSQPDEIHSLRSLLEATDKNWRAAVVVVGTYGDQVDCFSQFTQTSGARRLYFLPCINDLDRLQQILGCIQNRDQSGPTAGANGFFVDDLAASVSMAGKSKAIYHTLKMIKLVAGSNCNPVLITGETGTGKELVAKAVHTFRHPNGPLVAVNCAALTANLLESELFGHTKGSFTSADKDKSGLLELAGEGSIFLDEISEMPLDLQAKLLRVLQEKTFRKVGGVADMVCKATIIASSNRDLRSEVQANRFRRDLYYRLNICPISIAPLASAGRRADIRLLAEYFLKTSTVCPDKAEKITSFTEMALEAIEKHNWPGNVRELRNVIDRAILLETTDKVGLSSIFIDTQDFDQINCVAVEPSVNSFKSSTDFSLDKAERQLIARALQESGWQKTRAAALLGITRATLYAKVKQHNIQRGVYISKSSFNESLCTAQPEQATVA